MRKVSGCAVQIQETVGAGGVGSRVATNSQIRLGNCWDAGLNTPAARSPGHR